MRCSAKAQLPGSEIWFHCDKVSDHIGEHQGADVVWIGGQTPYRKPTPAATQRAPFTHRLKSWPSSFRHILTGRKRFEIRKDDRDPRFQAGDLVELREFDPTSIEVGYTGRRALYFIGFVERSEAIPPGWCGFDLVSQEDFQRVALALRGER